MRGIYNSVTDIRRKVFSEIARMAYADDIDYAKRIEEIPYEILPGTKAKYRNSIFLERAIIGERLRLGMGLPLREMAEYGALSDGIEESVIATKYYDDPLINIIKFACNACPEKKVFVTNGCQGCLSHQCTEVCPKDAIHIVNGRSLIDQDKCIKCGRCMDACPYSAIVKIERPCAASCGMNAIGSDEDGKAVINYDKCVSCGMCLVNCPFGAIVDKGQIFQTIYSIKEGDEVIAAIAPAFVGQFGPSVTPDKVKAALMSLGFADVVEVAIGADLCTIEEAADFLDKVPEKQPFMATSCCPAWSVMAKKEFPQFAPYISMALTPMVLTARMIKKDHPNAKVVFIGPCAAKTGSQPQIRALGCRLCAHVRGSHGHVRSERHQFGTNRRGGTIAGRNQRWSRIRCQRRRGESREKRHREGTSGNASESAGRRRLEKLQDDAHDGESRPFERISARRNGLPGRLCRRRRYAAANPEIECGCQTVRDRKRKEDVG